ncbi:uncharacterized protein GLRG_11614 [Colletotrichum graminicola M1.001]|uniref:Uncharacterized protein n=1 Tax=Colletotrichum graminicola (strain M1.001 / M2 / FGSC 10212) TaxID=645133 RepID=E3R031_COLGM|nr:uncharacterized protein GLRG_11614 [Colletotrichum graminicola M1.001]EFQ36469.1 hypothetical protein GLRG_11614 [Colletotrichum graminicola M1.001]
MDMREEHGKCGLPDTRKQSIRIIAMLDSPSLLAIRKTNEDSHNTGGLTAKIHVPRATIVRLRSMSGQGLSPFTTYLSTFWILIYWLVL